MTGFFRQQEIRMAMKLLKWHFEKQKFTLPDDAALSLQASKLVDEAHRIAKERGKNVIGIIKDLISTFRN